MNPLNAEACQALVEKVTGMMKARYIFPEVAARFEADMRAKVAAGEYNQASDVYDIARRLTGDLQGSTHDRHLRVEYAPQFYEHLVAQAQNPDGADDEIDPRYIADGAQRNFGFERVERLTGNIGYIRLNEFFMAKFGGETAIATMAFVANTRALIFDLRYNGGGSPTMVQLLQSYLFDEPKHLNSFYTRHSDYYEQFWTHAYVPGKRLPKIPVYVLTSARTFSGAEEFTYNLKHMKRAAIIGETTGGGAHPVTPQPLSDGLILALCEARAVNPITNSNWEGTGIEPDIAVPAADALMKAHALALETIRDASTSAVDKALAEWDIETVRVMYHPAELPPETLNRYTGKFGIYRFFVRDGSLMMESRGFESRLTPVSDDVFADVNRDMLRYKFIASDALHVLRRNEPDAIVVPRSPD